MACLPLPPIPFPVLPAGFTISPPTPPLPGDVRLCCKMPAFPIASPPFQLPPLAVNSAFIAALTAAIAVAKTYIDARPLKCPKE